MDRFIKISGLSNVIFGSVFLIYWILYGVLLPFSELKTSIIPLVTDSDWIWVNTLGSFSPLFGIIGLTGLFYLQLKRNKPIGLIGFVLAVFGICILTGQLFWKTFIWKIIAGIDKELLQFDGPFYTDNLLMVVMITGRVLFSIGYFLLGISCRSIEGLPSFALQTMIIGAPLFGLGPLFGPMQHIIRLIGIFLFTTGLIWTGVKMLKYSPEKLS